jgi:hypothetical protein
MDAEAVPRLIVQPQSHTKSAIKLIPLRVAYEWGGLGGNEYDSNMILNQYIDSPSWQLDYSGKPTAKKKTTATLPAGSRQPFCFENSSRARFFSSHGFA